jgi:hypothetical protein
VTNKDYFCLPVNNKIRSYEFYFFASILFCSNNNNNHDSYNATGSSTICCYLLHYRPCLLNYINCRIRFIGLLLLRLLYPVIEKCIYCYCNKYYDQIWRSNFVCFPGKLWCRIFCQFVMIYHHQRSGNRCNYRIHDT